MKTPIAILFMLFSGWSIAQTAIISHKSHSGTASDFAYADPANYGGPPLMIERLVRINDTVVAAETNGMGPRTLLIINNRELQDSLRDSVKVLRIPEYQLDVLIGKDTSATVVPLQWDETPQQRLEKIEKEKVQPQENKKEAESKKRSRKSSLLYFGLILGASLVFGTLRKKLSRA